jgi:DNA-binding CsgD family transcriptional regulator
VTTFWYDTVNSHVPLRWPFVGRTIEAAAVVEALAEDDVNIILICGPAGVGKSRLAEECFERAPFADDRRGRCVANPTLRSIPFGAIAHLLTQTAVDVASSSGAAVAMFSAVRQALGREPFLIYVDDVQYLDDPSTALLVQLLHVRAIRLLATQRSGSELPDGLSNLLRSESLIRVDLGPLDRKDTADLTRKVLGGELTSSLEMALWESSQGNALYLRELVRGALGSGQIVRKYGIWAAEGELNGTRLLLDLVTERLGGLGERTLELAETLALCEPIGLGLIEAQGFGDEIAELERVGIAKTTRHGMRLEVRLSHPLFGDSLRANLPESARRRILRYQATALEALGMRRRGDDLLCVLWRLDAGLVSDREALVRATNSAVAGKDHPLTIRLARAAIAAGAGFEAIAPLAEAYYEQGQFAEAFALGCQAMETATADDQLVRLAINVHRVQLWGLDDARSAIDTLTATQQRISHPVMRQVLEAVKSSVYTFSYQPQLALEVVETVSSDISSVRLSAGVGEAAALAQLGRTTEAVSVATTNYEYELARQESTDPVCAALYLVTRAYSLVDDGQLTEGLIAASQAHTALVSHAQLIDRVWASLAAARAELICGHLDNAQRWAHEALATAEQSNVVHGQRLALTVLAACAGQMNRSDEAAQHLVRLEAIWMTEGFLGDEVVVGRAWALHCAGERERARFEITAGADRAMRRGALAIESFLRYEAARLGVGDDRRMTALAALCQGALVKARAMHVSGLVRRDPVLLESASLAFAKIGVDLGAAEAARTAARLYRARQAAASALRLDRLADEYGLRCPNADTPGLHTTESTVRLTDREQDVAALVATGLSSKDVASRLFLSVRTVDNHLRHIYTKLNITARSELVALFAEPATANRA